MNVQEIIEAFRSGLMWIGLGALSFITSACGFAGLRRVSRVLHVRLSPAAIGVFAVAAVVATSEAQKRSGATGTSRPTAALVGRAVLSAPLTFPHERTVNDVMVHLDGPRSGWLCRTAGVSVEPFWLPHFFPDGSAELTATISGCHSNAYLGCTWTGGAGIAFSHPHSLTTDVTYNPDEPDNWATNGIDLITQFVGYTLTNHVHLTVGTTNEPSTEFSVSCPQVMFLNDLSNGKRAERVYSVSLMLSGPHGIGGHVFVTSIAGAELRLFCDDALSVPATNAIPLYVPEEGPYETTTNLYLACTTLGNGMLRAQMVFDGGKIKTADAGCRVIEPLRRFVTTERTSDGRFFNPSCLVWGTNAALKVGVNTGMASFSPEEIRWSVVSGPGMVSPTNGLQTVLTPTADSGTVVVEARFNDDEIQPRFVLPIVSPMTINVRAFVVDPPDAGEAPLDGTESLNPWQISDVEERIALANKVFSQAGVDFQLVGVEQGVGSEDDWTFIESEDHVDSAGRRIRTISNQAKRLFALSSTNAPEIAIFFLGDIVSRKKASALRHHKWIVVGRRSSAVAPAHELGHVLGLGDCYVMTAANELIVNGDEPVKRGDFSTGGQDWGHESGRGFYLLEDTLESLAESMLMCGSDTEQGRDIPWQWVRSLRRDTLLEDDTIEAPVGALYINRNHEETYNR